MAPLPLAQTTSAPWSEKEPQRLLSNTAYRSSSMASNHTVWRGKAHLCHLSGPASLCSMSARWKSWLRCASQVLSPGIPAQTIKFHLIHNLLARSQRTKIPTPKINR